MKIKELLTADHIKLDSMATNREEVIHELVDLLAPSANFADIDAIKEMVMLREKEVGTGIGYGVAIPHCEPGPFDQPFVAFSRLKKGVDFHSPDGVKARLIFLLMTPEKTPALHVRLLARICRLLKAVSIRDALLEVDTPQDAAKIFADAEADYPELTA